MAYIIKHSDDNIITRYNNSLYLLLQVRASAVFIPEFSDLVQEAEKYMFAYSIRMSLKPEGCVVHGMSFDSCQLYWRRWITKSNDRVVGDINGEAVIGQVSFLLIFMLSLLFMIIYEGALLYKRLAGSAWFGDLSFTITFNV